MVHLGLFVFLLRRKSRRKLFLKKGVPFFQDDIDIFIDFLVLEEQLKMLGQSFFAAGRYLFLQNMSMHQHIPVYSTKEQNTYHWLLLIQVCFYAYVILTLYPSFEFYYCRYQLCRYMNTQSQDHNEKIQDTHQVNIFPLHQLLIISNYTLHISNLLAQSEVNKNLCERYRGVFRTA